MFYCRDQEFYISNKAWCLKSMQSALVTKQTGSMSMSRENKVGEREGERERAVEMGGAQKNKGELTVLDSRSFTRGIARGE